MKFTKCLILCLLVLSAVLISGCGGGGGTADLLCIIFNANGTPGAPSAVARQSTDSQCGLVVVELVLTGVSDVFTVSFDVSYNSAVADYDGYSLGGSRMSSDGASVNVLEDTDTPGQINLGVTRLASTGIDFISTATVIKLLFRPASGAVEGTTGIFNLSDTQILGSETPPLVKSGIQWSNGTFAITP